MTFCLECEGYERFRYVRFVEAGGESMSRGTSGGGGGGRASVRRAAAVAGGGGLSDGLSLLAPHIH